MQVRVWRFDLAAASSTDRLDQVADFSCATIPEGLCVNDTHVALLSQGDSPVAPLLHDGGEQGQLMLSWLDLIKISKTRCALLHIASGANQYFLKVKPILAP